jgi:hypothetical protein
VMAVELVNDGPFTIWLDSESARSRVSGAGPTGVVPEPGSGRAAL